jgi:hypothetical protein
VGHPPTGLMKAGASHPREFVHTEWVETNISTNTHTEKHPPFAKSAKDGAPAKTGAGFGGVVEWYHSRGKCRELWDYEWKLRKGGPPANQISA